MERLLAWCHALIELAAATEYQLAPPPTLAERLDGDHRIRRRPIRAGAQEKHRQARASKLRQLLDDGPPIVLTTPAAKPRRIARIFGRGPGAELARLQRGGH